MSASTSSFCFGAAVPKLGEEVLAQPCQNWVRKFWRVSGCASPMRKKEPNKPATDEEKRELALKLKEFYESAAPGLVQQGTGILRKFGISEQVLGKLTNLDDFSQNVLADPNLTVQHIEEMTAFMRKVQGEGPRIFKTTMREMVKGLPRLPGGGRPRVTDEKRQAMRKEVLELLNKGESRVSVALKRVARSHEVSYRTMQRIWAQPQGKFRQKG